ncbi:hypothetical protein CDCA_CDCA06G1867 [Cyanidium caldarium]|uniref:Aminopeptidase n=1 Tax=Cyanidium caldarium TaxID=2771 RepID=A0AAV9IU57_CYACA|nr:hypothetical protein CDCA_CDCA06G1867 [Cyanidium caldarium]
MSATSSNRQLLPDNVCPLAYDITLEPELSPAALDLVNAADDEAASDAPQGHVRAPGGQRAGGDDHEALFVFHGQETVEIEVRRPTRDIVLHALEMQIRTARIDGDLEVESISMDTDAQTATLRFPQELQPSRRYRLWIEFRGNLNAKMVGFYRSKYRDAESGAVRYMAVTQFEATDARQAFPCWDEPSIKSKFRVTLIAPPGRTCLSNMPVEREAVRESDGKQVVRFAETPIMSTYLLAFVVGEFDYVEAHTAEKVRVRVYTQRGQSHLGQFALECATRVLSFFTEFFGIPYPLPKEDLIAIPDFAAGAMENWGLITFRETALLLDPKQSAASVKSRVAEVVAHELAHQWFGNLVTMEWWTHLWLNEGFATWAAELAVDHMFPRWQQWMQFVSATFSAALRLDGLKSSHPIEVEVRRAQEVNEIFDAISYCKGASVIRMLANYLGLEAFQAGLRRYLKRFMYANASTDDLWRALEEESGKPIAPMMRSWTRQTGYPVIEVDDEAMTLSQTRFLADGGAADDAADDQSWMVPLGLVDSRQPRTPRYQLLAERHDALLQGDRRALEEVEWIKVNAGQTGVFRVNYRPGMWARLVKPIRDKALGATDRLGLSMDALALTKAGRLPASIALQVLSAFDREDDYSCWTDVVGSLGELCSVFVYGDEALQVQFNEFAARLLQRIGEQVGWEPQPDEEHVTALLRALVLGALGRYAHPATVQEARRRWARERKALEPVVADLRYPVMATVVQHGGEAEFDSVLETYRAAKMDEERVRCIRALSCTRDPSRMAWMLEWGLDRAQVKAQDAIYVYASVAAASAAGRHMAWRFLRDHWAVFFDRYGKGNFLLSNYVASTLRDHNQPEVAAEVQAFFDGISPKQREGIARTIQQSLERIRTNAAWKQRDQQAVQSWLTEYLAQ